MPSDLLDAAAVIVAGGRSERMAGEDKLWTSLRGTDGCAHPLIAYSIAAFQSCGAISRVVLVVAPPRLKSAHALVADEGYEKVVAIVPGGSQRRDSVLAGLVALGQCRYVAIHDGARPLVTGQLIEDALAAAQGTGASCVAIPISDTVKETAGTSILRTLDRSTLMLAQTPQAFRYDLLMEAHKLVTADATDDASMVEALGVSVCIATGSSRNIKVTTPDDLLLAQALLDR